MLSMAVLMTLVAVNIHHHHHGEQMYIAWQENCEAGAQNGQNGQDEQSGQDEQDENVDHTQRYMPGTIVKVSPADMATHLFDGFHFFFSFLPANIVAVPLATITADHSFPKHPSTLYSSQGRLCRGLRAPPAC